MKANGGTGGIDGISVEAVELYGVGKLLGEIQATLIQGQYRLHPVKRVHIPKPNGTKCRLGIQTIRDRIVQMAVKMVIEPVYEKSRQH